LNTGIATFYVRVELQKADATATVTVALYAEPGQTTLLGQETVMLDIMAVPLHISLPLLLVLLCIGVGCIRRQHGASGRN
jgi:hypothetical protein